MPFLWVGDKFFELDVSTVEDVVNAVIYPPLHY